MATKQKSEKKVEEIGAIEAPVMPKDLGQALSDFMDAVKASSLPVSRKSQVEKILRTRVRKALSL